MKLDVGLGVQGGVHDIGRTARAAEQMSFDGLWTSETKHDSFLPLALAAGRTQRRFTAISTAAVLRASWPSSRSA